MINDKSTNDETCKIYNTILNEPDLCIILIYLYFVISVLLIVTNGRPIDGKAKASVATVFPVVSGRNESPCESIILTP